MKTLNVSSSRRTPAHGGAGWGVDGHQSHARDGLQRIGEVAERFKAAVLKTVDSKGSGGSNPSLSAIF